MATAKQVKLLPISRQDGDRVVKALHYSGKVVNNSRIHLGVFLNGKCLGCLQFGPPTDYSKASTAFPDLPKRSLIELNRMALHESLPRNTASRSIAVAVRMLRGKGIEMIQSYADATQSGDGAIYRATGFLLVSVKMNTQLWKLPDGEVTHCLSYDAGKAGGRRQRIDRARLKMPTEAPGRVLAALGAERLRGFQMRYLLPLTEAARQSIILEHIPYDDPRVVAARMYKGKRLVSIDSDAPAIQAGEGGANPTTGLHSDAEGGENAKA